MAIYSLSLSGTVGTSAAPSWDAKPAAANTPKVMEYGYMNGAATASVLAIGRTGNTSTQTGGVLVQAENPGDAAGQTSCALAWSAAPTQPSQYFRRANLPATIGSGIIFTFPRGITLAAGGAGLLQWNVSASSAVYQTHVVVDE